MRTRLTPLQQGRLWEAQFRAGRLRETGRRRGRRMTFREAARNDRMLRRAIETERVAGPAIRRFYSSYAPSRGRGSSAVRTFVEAYRRPE